jgi:hypothetical protein
MVQRNLRPRHTKAGSLTGWEFDITDQQTSVTQNGGVWCLPNAPVVTHASMFNEIIESHGPCRPTSDPTR